MADTDNSQLVPYSTAMDQNIATFLKIKELAEFVAQSDTFTKGFEQKDAKGNVLLDEATGKAKINVADIAIALMVGNRCGLNLAESVILGSKLNTNTYLAVLRGRELGIGIATSMEKIYTIPTKNGLISYTGVDIIMSKLLQGGVNITFIKQNAPFYIYYSAQGEELDLDVILNEDDSLKDNYFVVHPKTDAEVLRKELAAGKTAVTKVLKGRYSKVTMTRQIGNTVLKFSKRFSTFDAQQAGLLELRDANNNVIVAGKDNWNKAYPQMLDNRVVTICGRLIGADLIQGLYSEEEAKEVAENRVEDGVATDVTK